MALQLTKEERREVTARLCTDSLLHYARAIDPDYLIAPHIRKLADALEGVASGRIKRLVINMPPRHGKTRLASELFTAWWMARNPGSSVIFATYAQEFANDLGRKVRGIIRSDRHQHLFPWMRVADDSNAVQRFHIAPKRRGDKEGAYFAVGVGGPITGRGADLLLIDDPVKGREQAESAAYRRQLHNWYSNDARTRLMPGGAVIVIQTRWHMDDLAGWVTREHAHENWELVSLPAILRDGQALWPERYSVDDLQTLRRSMSERDWLALYMQQPSAETGNIIKRSWWQRWTGERPKCERIIQVWDTAFGEKNANDYSACTTWGVFRQSGAAGDDFSEEPRCLMLLGAWRGRVSFPDLRTKARALYKEWEPDVVLVEAKASGQSLIQEFRRAKLPVRSINPGREDKRSRAWSITHLFEAGRIYAPASFRWVDEVIEETAAFPQAQHDDYTDTVVMAAKYLRDMGAVLHPDEDEDERDAVNAALLRKARPRAAVYG